MGGRVSSLVFQPPAKPSHINSTKYILLPTAKGNMIPAFYFDRSAHLTILVSHGNAEDLGESSSSGVGWKRRGVGPAVQSAGNPAGRRVTGKTITDRPVTDPSQQNHPTQA